MCGLAEQGFSVIGFDAGPYWRPLEEFASDESEQHKLYWLDDRLTVGENPITMGGKNSGKSVGGSTVHFAMVSLRFRPDWFKSRSTLGYGADWPVDWREMWDYYTRAERALAISGPITYPWGPRRAALSLSRASVERGRRPAGAGGGGDGLFLDGDAAGDRFGPARRFAALRLSRILPVRLLDERQAEPASDLHPARDRGWRRDPRPGDGRADRDGRGRARVRRALPPERTLALPAGAERRGGRAMRSRRRGCCCSRPRIVTRMGLPTAPGWSANI